MFCFWPGDKAFRPIKKFYELRNFTNMKRKDCPKCSFFNLVSRQMRVKINKKVALFIEYSTDKKVKILLSPTLPTPMFLSPFIVTHPPKINELVTFVTATPVLRHWHPPKVWTCTYTISKSCLEIGSGCCAIASLLHSSLSPLLENSSYVTFLFPEWRFEGVI